MSKRWMLAGSLTALALSLTFQRGWAKAPIGKITIDAPNHFADVEITDPLDLETLGDSVFFFNDSIENEQITQALEMGYLLTRFLDFGVIDGIRQFEPLDQLLYFPDPAGGPGLVYYLGMIRGNTEYDGRFYRISEADDSALRQILEAHEIGPASPGRGSPLDLPFPSLAFALPWLSAGMVGAAAGWILGQRQGKRGNQPA